ncbi:MAG: TIGR01777 family oxidoreductase [Solirubrobacterales bacterium]|nr:TIGR01777 family oxidoreductase [Solirubrobacterales bacterium]
MTVTGATGLVGSALVDALRRREAEVTALSRDPERARSQLGVAAVAWNPGGEPAPAGALTNRDAVVHLAGEPIAQRWSERAKRAIRESRVHGTRHLVEGMRAARVAPRVLICGSAIGYYGRHGEEPLDEESPAGVGFLAQTCVAWERQAQEAAAELPTRLVLLRTGVVLDRRGGALAKMLPAFRLGVGGPIAGGGQYISWVHPEDLVGMVLAALEDERWWGPVNGTAPAPVTNRHFSRTLGSVLHRPALAPLPALPLRMRYGEMAEVVTAGQRVLPAKALVLGFRHRHPELREALEAVLR